MASRFVFVSKSLADDVSNGYRRKLPTQDLVIGEAIRLRPLPDHPEDAGGEDVPAIVIEVEALGLALVGPPPPPPPV